MRRDHRPRVQILDGRLVPHLIQWVLRPRTMSVLRSGMLRVLVAGKSGLGHTAADRRVPG